MITKRTQFGGSMCRLWPEEIGLTFINSSTPHLSRPAGLSTPSPSSHVILLLALFLVIHWRFPSRGGGLEHHHHRCHAPQHRRHAPHQRRHAPHHGCHTLKRDATSPSCYSSILYPQQLLNCLSLPDYCLVSVFPTKLVLKFNLYSDTLRGGTRLGL